MATDFNKLWRREVEKLNRQIHKYEKEGVRFRVSPIEENVPNKKYTQADLDLIKAKRLTLFEGAELFDDQTWKTYRGKDEITNRIRQRKAQAEENKRNYTLHQGRASVEAKETEIKATLADSIAFTLLEIAQSFDSRNAFAGRTEWFYQQKDSQSYNFVSFINNLISNKDFVIAIEPYPELVEDLRSVLYDSTEFIDTPRTQALVNKLFELANRIGQISNEEKQDFNERYSIEDDYDEGTFMF